MTTLGDELTVAEMKDWIEAHDGGHPKRAGTPIAKDQVDSNA
jgi:hypothetical protein